MQFYGIILELTTQSPIKTCGKQDKISVQATVRMSAHTFKSDHYRELNNI